MSYAELSGMVVVRPLGAFPQERTSDPQPSLFRSVWADTVALLTRELKHLNPERVLLEMDFRPTQLRVDGLPRADARPASDAVVLRIELEPGSWLTYPCDTYSDWQDNVRAIALTLGKLRDIDRYGVSKRKEQYRGWAQIPARTGADPIHSVEGAAAFLAEHSGLEAEAIQRFGTVRESARKRAAARLHPDAGGTREGWDRLGRAVRVLELNEGVGS